MILETARLRLRPVNMFDVDALVALDSDPAVMRFVSGGTATPHEVVADWVLPRAQAEYRQHRTGMWAALERSRSAHGTDEFAGWFALRTPRHSDRAELELSYRLRRTMWGRGLATEAARALLAMSFQELAAERVFAGTMAANLPSRRVMEKIGMHLSAIRMSPGFGTAGVGGPAHGEVEYELLRGQWSPSVAPTRMPARPLPRAGAVPAGARHRRVADLSA